MYPTTLQITNDQTPAFAEAASRRQANNQIITNFQIPITKYCLDIG
jgi:hypothetical protein